MNGFLEDVKSGKYLVAIHNGYDGFSYGCPRDPMVFDYTEYCKLTQALSHLGIGRMFECFAMGNDFDLTIPPQVTEVIGEKNRLLTITNRESLVFSSDEERDAREREKQAILQRLSAE